MGWYKHINSILKDEPETWLAYLYGQQFENFSAIHNRKPLFRGFALQLFKFICHILKNMRLSNSGVEIEGVDYLIFANTDNQLAALKTTINALHNRNKSLAVLVGKRQLDTKGVDKAYCTIWFNLKDVYRAFRLLLSRGPRLYFSFKRVNAEIVKFHFNEFCKVYIYLVYFLRVLGSSQPKYVIVANDHSVSNRSILAVAHFLGIKTVYLQHASVSSLFPALRVNYAFLDGQSALDTYRLCERNQPQSGFSAPFPKIILSGQKKYIARSKKLDSMPIGVAINTLDDYAMVTKFVCTLLKAGKEVRLRWHPAQSQEEQGFLQRALAEQKNISFSNPRKESVSDFFSEIEWLVAANTSIHLEAVLAGVSSIYYEFGQPDKPDYYGYVRNGLAKSANSVEEVISLIEGVELNNSSNIDAVRYYSATYMTAWDGKEGELVADCLCRLMTGSLAADPFYVEELMKR